jgi:hypothetical protein
MSLSAAQQLTQTFLAHPIILLSGYDKYVRGNVLGRGSFGQVRTASSSAGGLAEATCTTSNQGAGFQHLQVLLLSFT